MFHGGQRGLRLGGWILPPSKSGARGTLLETARRHNIASPAKADVVYVAAAFEAALFFAASHPSRGWVYEVEPHGELRPDPDCDLPGLSWECEKARIVGIRKPTRAQVFAVMQALGAA